MNLQTVDDLIQDLQALPAHQRRQPVSLKIDSADCQAVEVRPQGDHVELVQAAHVADIDHGVPLPSFRREVTCPECQHDFAVDSEGVVY
jgi:hypothetical protein